jgi:hypothetical protein
VKKVKQTIKSCVQVLLVKTQYSAMPKSNGLAPEHSGSKKQLDYLLITVLPKLWKNPLSSPFKRPICTEELHYYNEIIKCPLDLSTIKKKLLNNDYTSAKQAIKDLSRMILNCFIYNNHTDAVVNMARSLLSDLNEALQGMPVIETDTQRALTPAHKIKQEPTIKIKQEKTMRLPLLDASSTIMLPLNIARQPQYNLRGTAAKAIIARPKKKADISSSALEMASNSSVVNSKIQVNLIADHWHKYTYILGAILQFYLSYKTLC